MAVLREIFPFLASFTITMCKFDRIKWKKVETFEKLVYVSSYSLSRSLGNFKKKTYTHRLHETLLSGTKMFVIRSFEIPRETNYSEKVLLLLKCVGVQSRFLSFQKGTFPKVFRNAKFLISSVGRTLLSHREWSFKFRCTIGEEYIATSCWQFFSCTLALPCVGCWPQIGNNSF